MTQRDPIAIAAAVVAGRQQLASVSTVDMLAICRALVEAGQVPQISDELAGAVRVLVEAEQRHTMAKGADGSTPLEVGIVREQAFLTFKRIFQEEFPDV